MTGEIVQSVNRLLIVESGNRTAGQRRTETAVLSRNGSTASFDEAYREAVVSNPARTPVAIRQLPSRHDGVSTQDKTQKAFEAAALQTFIATMMPNESGKFSAGSAGKMWKSVLAEKIAERITASGSFRLLPSSAFSRSLEVKQAPAVPSVASRPVATTAGGGPWQTSIAMAPMTTGIATLDVVRPARSNVE